MALVAQGVWPATLAHLGKNPTALKRRRTMPAAAAPPLAPVLVIRIAARRITVFGLKAAKRNHRPTRVPAVAPT